jgi:hypothetical protein
LKRPFRHCALGIAAGLALLAPAALQLRAPARAGSGLEDFGRWQTHLQQCRMAHSGETGQRDTARECQLLRLDQQMQGLLTVRFLAMTTGSQLASSELVYAGVLESGSPPMLCRQGRCDPRWPMRVLVSAVAPSGIDSRGLAVGVPQASVARGQCLLVKRRARCQAGEPGGQRWEASARW